MRDILTAENIVAIDFTDEMRPFTIWTLDGDSVDIWGAEHCKEYGSEYYHCLGGCPLHCIRDGEEQFGIKPDWNYWVQEGVVYQECADHASDDPRCRHPKNLGRLPEGFAIDEWLENANEGEAYPCSVCDDWYPEDSTCTHMRWCDPCADFVVREVWKRDSKDREICPDCKKDVDS